MKKRLVMAILAICIVPLFINKTTSASFTQGNLFVATLDGKILEVDVSGNYKIFADTSDGLRTPTGIAFVIQFQLNSQRFSYLPRI